MSPIISFKDVTKRFSDGTEALKNITIDIPTNQLTVIIGPSGCGKTTLMKMINRLESPTSGSIYIDDQAIANRDPVELRRSIGYVIQRIGLIPHMTIEENVALVPNLLGWDKKKTHERVCELLDLVDLSPDTFLKRYPLELSGGKQQRIGVSRALASDPNIILMDEPFSALDPISREQLQYELKELQRKIRKTIVFVTHDMDEALDIADYIILMRDGQIEQAATPTSLLENQASSFVTEFIGEKRISRKRHFHDRRLKEFQALFEPQSEKKTQKIAHTSKVKEAVASLDEDPEKMLQVMDGQNVLGYIGYQQLLKAAMNGRESNE